MQIPAFRQQTTQGLINLASSLMVAPLISSAVFCLAVYFIQQELWLGVLLFVVSAGVGNINTLLESIKNCMDCDSSKSFCDLLRSAQVSTVLDGQAFHYDNQNSKQVSFRKQRQLKHEIREMAEISPAEREISLCRIRFQLQLSDQSNQHVLLATQQLAKELKQKDYQISISNKLIVNGKQEFLFFYYTKSQLVPSLLAARLAGSLGLAFPWWAYILYTTKLSTFTIKIDTIS